MRRRGSHAAGPGPQGLSDRALRYGTLVVFATPVTTAVHATNRVIAHGLTVSSHQVVLAVAVVVMVLALRARSLLSARRRQ